MSQPILTLTVGCGGAGKSRVLALLYPGLDCIDSDRIKETLPGYDPRHPELTHDESSRLAMRAFFGALAEGRDFAFDGTGKNLEKYIGLIASARAAGFLVRVLYVRAGLDTCLARNANRARRVPAEVILSTWQAIQHTAPILAAHADYFVEVNNS